MKTIKEWREFQSLSVMQLAAALGTHPSTVHAWENGTRVPLASSLYRLATTLKVPVAWIDLELPEQREYTRQCFMDP